MLVTYPDSRLFRRLSIIVQFSTLNVTMIFLKVVCPVSQEKVTCTINAVEKTAPVEQLVPMVPGLTMEMVNSAEEGNEADMTAARDIVIAYGAGCLPLAVGACANGASYPECPALLCKANPAMC